MKRTHISTPEPSSKFNKVSCAECEEEQVVYSHATSKVACNSCGNVITQPTGSLAILNGKVLKSAE